MNCLVTGGTGFSGASLVRRLAAGGRTVSVLIREGSGRQVPNGVTALTGDITDEQGLREAVARCRPTEIYHLAARTFVPDAFKDGLGFLHTNLMGTVNLLEAAAAEAPAARVLVASSAGVYGAGGQEGRPLREQDGLQPMDPYGASKAAAEIWALQEARRGRLEIVCVRPFGHIGPRQSTRFVAASFAQQIRRIRAGSQEPLLQVGNLDAVREFTDVEDMAAGYVAAMERGKPGSVYNLCSGRGVSVRQLLMEMLAVAEVDAQVVTDSQRLRPVDIPSLVGDPGLAQKELKWTPSTPRHETLAGMLNGPRTEPS